MSRAWKVKKLDPDAPLAINARRILAVRIAEFYSWEPIVDDDDQSELLHQLRISAKRLRYTLELFRDEFGETGERNIERVRQVQDVLGRFHDHDVRIALIEDELRASSVTLRTICTCGAGRRRSQSAARDRLRPRFARRRTIPGAGLMHLLAVSMRADSAYCTSFASSGGTYAKQRCAPSWSDLSAIPIRSSAETS